MQLEIKSRKLNLKGNQRCLAPCTPIPPILFPSQILWSNTYGPSKSKNFSSQSSSRRCFVDGTVSVPSRLKTTDGWGPHKAPLNSTPLHTPWRNPLASGVADLCMHHSQLRCPNHLSGPTPQGHRVWMEHTNLPSPGPQELQCLVRHHQPSIQNLCPWELMGTTQNQSCLPDL